MPKSGRVRPYISSDGFWHTKVRVRILGCLAITGIVSKGEKKSRKGRRIWGSIYIRGFGGCEHWDVVFVYGLERWGE